MPGASRDEPQGSPPLSWEDAWIPIAVLSALCQTVRTAALKVLNRDLSLLVSTYVRFIFGLPILVTYALAVLYFGGEGWPMITWAFVAWTAISSATQSGGTALLLQLLTLRNFAVGGIFMKADLIFTALLGTALFSEVISAKGWLSIGLAFAGVILVSTAKLERSPLSWRTSATSFLTDRSTHLGLGVALTFALSYLSLREATLTLAPGGVLHRGAWAGLLQALLQVVFLGAWLLWREPAGLWKMRHHLGLATFIGTISGIGTITWFTASAMQNSSYVAAVGQVQVVFTLLISWFYFRERILTLELIGIAVIIAGVLLFRL
jgi:drug/metabolite transporter (DMT)-like permease